MKRKISFGIAVLMILVACLLVSCNSEVSTTAQANDGKLVYATFDKMSKAIRPSSSSMTISYELDNINDLYWVYTATKTDGAGTTGQTPGARVPGDTTTHKGLGGAIGPFSKGTWTFTVEGYKYTGEATNPTVEQLRNGTNESKLIYVGTADGVVFNVTKDAENPETIDITVYLQTQGGTGTLKIAANSKFFWAASGEGGYALEDLKLKVYDGETLKETIALEGNASDSSVSDDAVYYSNANDTSIDGLASGDHVFKVQIVRNVGGADQVFFEGTVNAKIYAGITTALDTQAIEGLFTYAQFNGTIDDSAVVVVATKSVTTISAGSVSFETDYTPASGINPVPSISNEKTTVAIDSTVIENNTTYNLGVETSNIIAAGAKFSVASGSTAVASVDLTLTKTEGSTKTIVSDFGTNGAATVTTYIAKNLTDVAFFHENTAFDKVNSDTNLSVNEFYYEKTTGRLVFKTSHFSEFYVTSNDEAYNLNKNEAYATFVDSMADADSTNSVVILKDVDAGYTDYSWTDKYGNTYASEATAVASGNASNSNPVLITCSLDLNGHTIKAPNFTLLVVANNAQISNGTVFGYSNLSDANLDKTKLRSYAIAIAANNVKLSKVTTKAGISFGASKGETPATICKGAVDCVIEDCEIYAACYYAICTQMQSSVVVKNTNLRRVAKDETYAGTYSSGTIMISSFHGQSPDWGNVGDTNGISFDNVKAFNTDGTSATAPFETLTGFVKSVSENVTTWTANAAYSTGSFTYDSSTNVLSGSGSARVTQ